MTKISTHIEAVNNGDVTLSKSSDPQLKAELSAFDLQGKRYLKGSEMVAAFQFSRKKVHEFKLTIALVFVSLILHCAGCFHVLCSGSHQAVYCNPDGFLVKA